ncbi:hypothetical protein [Candidatus Pantoea multigeneris]|uniref:Insecticidal toxin complex protein n=1 Tax=Candidatus Pantoea multigeneris TaxID=2608357 RepID=A0ABX0R620_9GAMM|nr:hypothetical protein [Pantoea multigeneris]NIF20547.1 hypothetical protein [Pantoea multigeneris]
MSDNYIPPSLVEAEKENIHFNTLMRDAREVVEQLAGKTWTDTALHDPGITLLEALAWNISDISYRCLLPLQDLLTLENAPVGSGLFPPNFVPEEMLTTSPVTAEDYRRGILDLYHQGTPAGFYFADATITRDPRVAADGETNGRFHYYYDAVNRNFVFKKPVKEKPEDPVLPGPPRMELFGSYQVVAQISQLPRLNLNDDAYKQKLTNYLEQHRNLGEVFRSVSVLSAKEEVITLSAKIEADELLEDVDACYANLYLALQNVLAARLERQEKVDLARGEYHGPKAAYGWITKLPPGQLGGKKVISLSHFNTALTAVEGVKAVRELAFDGVAEKEKFFRTLTDKLPVLWGASRDLDKQVALMLEKVLIYRNGVQIAGKASNIVSLIALRFASPRSQVSPPYPLGRYRHLRRYYPASLVVPPLYQLQQVDPTPEVRQLHHFLLGFEQHLASNLQQLENLTRLLNLSTDHLSMMEAYGAQWPFAEGSVLDAVYRDDKDADLKEKLINTAEINQMELSAMLRLIRFLLNYFGIEDFNKQITTDQQLLDNLYIGLNLLRQVPEVGYKRTVFINNQVSSLQRRLAGQLGIGKEMFSTAPDIRQLSFYVVEHALLLPDMPPEQGQAPLKISQAKELQLGTETFLVLETNRELTGYMTRKHMVDLKYKIGTEPEVHIGNLLVMQLGNDVREELWLTGTGAPKRENSFLLLPGKFAQLRAVLKEILALDLTKTTLNASFSDIWLNEMKYLLDKEHAEVIIAGTNKYKITTNSDQPWPQVLRKGDTLTLERTYYAASKTKERTASNDYQYEATVDAVDPVTGYANITVTDSADDPVDFEKYRYYWFIKSKDTLVKPASHDDLLQRDRFSFTLSVVLPLRYIGNVKDKTAQQIEAEDQRVRKIVQGEVPAHIQVRVLWLTDEQFASFSSTYASWQNQGMAVGEDSLKLMRMLSLGMLAELVEGIGIARIPDHAESARLTAIEARETVNGVLKPFKEWTVENQAAWNKEASDNFLLFVAPDD